MDLLTLVFACAAGFPEPSALQALVIHQSDGQPYTYRRIDAGDHPRMVFPSPDQAIAAATAEGPDARLEIGLAGLPATPSDPATARTGLLFPPCLNLMAAAHRLADLYRDCSHHPGSEVSPLRCALGHYRAGSAESPDDGFADTILALARTDLPNPTLPGPPPSLPGPTASTSPPVGAAGPRPPPVTLRPSEPEDTGPIFPPRAPDLFFNQPSRDAR